MRLADRIRLGYLRRCQKDEAVLEITPLNTLSEWENASADTLLFHWVNKVVIARAVRRIRVPDSWIAVLPEPWATVWEILDDLFRHDRSARRLAFLVPIARYAITKCAYDNHYGEFGQAVLAALIRNRDRLAIDPQVINPHNWFQDGRGRIEIRQTQEPFAVLAQTDTDLVVSARLEAAIVTTCPHEAGGLPRYLAIDLDGAIEPWPGIIAYPILSSGPSPLDVAPALIAQEASRA